MLPSTLGPRSLRRRGVRAAVASAAVVLLTATAACSRTAEPGTREATTASDTATPSGASARAGHRVQKLLVFVVENHSMDQMQAGMPWVYRFAKRYGHTTRYRAVTHPSLPNYLAIAGGSTFGVTDDASPASHPLSGPSVFGAAVAHGSTARLYAEGMASRCQLEPSGRYAVKHNPWAYFTDERAACARGDVPLQRYGRDVDAGRLPAVGMVIPDLCHDAHDCGLGTADQWLRAKISRALAGPDWRAGRLAIVVTADEDDRNHGNRVLTVVAHPSVRNAVVRTRLSHYSLTRSYADVAGIPAPRQGAGARSLLRQFGLVAG